jgi:quercetin dioxygenase-like cupin family protein
MPIRLFRCSAGQGKPIQTYTSAGAHSCELGHGTGESHVYVIFIEPRGIIGPHPAGFDQVLIVIKGSGWVAGSDGIRHKIEEESGAFIPLGENHSKGSTTGMVAVMLQASKFNLVQEP